MVDNVPTTVDPASSASATALPVPVPVLDRPATNPFRARQPSPGPQRIHTPFPRISEVQELINQHGRLVQLQQETHRLHQEIGMIEQRLRSMTPPNLHNAPQTGPQLSANIQVQNLLRAHNAQQAAAQTASNVQVQNLLRAESQAQAQLQNMLRPAGGFIPGQPLPPPFQNYVHQGQQARASQGLHGVQDNGAPNPGVTVPVSGRASPSINRPEHTTTYTREGVGPNGERWHMTVNQTTTILPPAHVHPHHHHHHPTVPFGQSFPGIAPPSNPAVEIQAILRHADRLNSQREPQPDATNAQPAESDPAIATTGSQQPAEVPNPAGPPAGGSSLNPIHAPLPLRREVQTPNVAATTTNPNQQPTAFVLSSPSGPQALLLMNSGTYWTPRSSRHSSPSSRNQNSHGGPAVGFPEFRNRDPAQRAARRAQRALQNNPPAPAVNPPHGNPGAGALAAQLAPILWLLLRLSFFVWFFASGNTTWTRFILICTLATVMFIAQTGLFNGLAEQLWGPIRRHLEALIPLAGPDAALVPAANAAAIPLAAPPAGGNDEVNPGLRQRRRNGEPDQAVVAATILERHRRANQGWLYTQFRRIEHSMLLFLASLVPGVGERHIAAREAEAIAAEAERQREIEAAAVEANTEATGAEGGPRNESSEEPAVNQGNVEGNAAPTAAPPRLVDV